MMTSMSYPGLKLERRQNDSITLDEIFKVYLKR